MIEKLIESDDDGAVAFVVERLRRLSAVSSPQVRPQPDCGPAVVPIGKDNFFVCGGQKVHIYCSFLEF